MERASGRDNNHTSLQTFSSLETVSFERTDHGSLRWIFSFKDRQGQLARWLDVLSQYDFEIQHPATPEYRCSIKDWWESILKWIISDINKSCVESKKCDPDGEATEACCKRMITREDRRKREPTKSGWNATEMTISSNGETHTMEKCLATEIRNRYPGICWWKPWESSMRGSWLES